jgi:hypothetical protein
VPAFPAAPAIARGSAEFREIGAGDFAALSCAPGRAIPGRRAISFTVGGLDATDVLIDEIGRCHTRASRGCRSSGS